MRPPRKNSLRAWLLAARPKTLAAALTPVFVAAALALTLQPCLLPPASALRWTPWLWCVAFAALMQIDSNLINDFFDFRRGGDGAARLGPQRATASGWIAPRAMLLGIALCTLLGAASGIMLLVSVPDAWWFVLVGAGCLLAAFLYTLGAAQRGWGDVLVLVFFGLVPVVCTFYALCGCVCAEAFAAGLATGLVIDPLLILNNFRDHAEDARAQKRTLIVRLGRRAGPWLYLLSGLFAVALLIYSTWERAPYFGLYTLAYLPLHFCGAAKCFRLLRCPTPDPAAPDTPEVRRQRDEIRTRSNAILAISSAAMLLFALLTLFSVPLSRIGTAKDRLWLHRCNSLEKREAFAQRYPNCEVDVHWRTADSTLAVGHDDNQLGALTLEEYFTHTPEDLNHNLWLDMKNLTPENVAQVEHYLARILPPTHRQGHPRIICESQNIQALEYLTQRGYYTSWYVPFDRPSRLSATEHAAALAAIRENARHPRTRAISSPYFWFRDVQTATRGTDIDILTWSQNTRQWEFFCLPRAYRFLAEPRLKVCLLKCNP